MKYLLSILIALAIGFSFQSCEKEDYTESNAAIIGPDLGLCPCCGGYIIELENDTGDYRFDNLPANSGIDLEQTIFPIDVEIEYEIDRECGGFTYLLIDEIELL